MYKLVQHSLIPLQTMVGLRTLHKPVSELCIVTCHVPATLLVHL